MHQVTMRAESVSDEREAKRRVERSSLTLTLPFTRFGFHAASRLLSLCHMCSGGGQLFDQESRSRMRVRVERVTRNTRHDALPPPPATQEEATIARIPSTDAPATVLRVLALGFVATCALYANYLQARKEGGSRSPWCVCERRMERERIPCAS